MVKNVNILDFTADSIHPEPIPCVVLFNRWWNTSCGARSRLGSQDEGQLVLKERRVSWEMTQSAMIV